MTQIFTKEEEKWDWEEKEEMGKKYIYFMCE